jgi:hypothetical protein
MNIEDADKILETEEAHLLCANCHLKRQATRFYDFNDIITRHDMFDFTTPELLELIENYKDCHPDYIYFPVYKKRDLKDSIKIWIKIRYIIEMIFFKKW